MAGFQFFGLQLGLSKSEKIKSDSEVFVTDNRDGVLELEFGDHYVSTVDFNTSIAKTSNNIRRYREIAEDHDVENAVTDVVNEAIVSNTDEKILELDLSNIDDKDLSKQIKQKVMDEHKKICNILNFDRYAEDMFRQWYVDGRSYYHVIVDSSKKKDGIKDIVPLDPRLMQKIREVKREMRGDVEVITGIEEYFMYSEQQADPKYQHTNRPIRQNVIKIHKDAVVYVNSGLIDDKTNLVVSYLHKVIKPFNQYQMMKDSVLIYRLSRAPERRIFYIDVGSLSSDKVSEYMNKTVDKYRSKMTYDPESGTVKQKNAGMSVMEDFFLPRREGGKGTEIDTLPSGQNLGDIEDLQFFQKELYKSLHVPMSRIESENSFNAGKDAEITRDELKFSKFIKSLRIKFVNLFVQLLERQVLLKNIMTRAEWDAIKNDIKHIFAEDFYLEEVRFLEIFRDRLAAATEAEDHIGNYISRDYVKREVFKQDDKEIEEQTKLMDKEKESGEAEHFDTDPEVEDFEEEPAEEEPAAPAPVQKEEPDPNAEE